MGEIQRFFSHNKTIIFNLLKIFQVKVCKTHYTWSPNLYHLKKKHHLFKIEQLNKIPQLSKEEREMAFGMLQVGIGQREVLKRFGCSHKTIFQLLQCFNAINSTSDRPRNGRPQVTTPTPPPRRTYIIRLRHLQDSFLPATVTARTLLDRRVTSKHP